MEEKRMIWRRIRGRAAPFFLSSCQPFLSFSAHSFLLHGWSMSAANSYFFKLLNTDWCRGQTDSVEAGGGQAITKECFPSCHILSFGIASFFLSTRLRTTEWDQKASVFSSSSLWATQMGYSWSDGEIKYAFIIATSLALLGAFVEQLWGSRSTLGNLAFFKLNKMERWSSS